MRFIKWFFGTRPQPSRPCVRPHLEALESRLVPYATSGNLWPHPNLITISFEPDGTNLGGVTSNLVKTWNAKFGSAAAWQNEIVRTAQQWAMMTNINFSVINDSGAASGSGSYQQGDSTKGDIRIGGYKFGNSTLATTYLPAPADNYSIAGDIAFNTGQTFNIGSNYDVFSVAMHEIGHALGLLHASSSSSVMYASYTSVMSGLSSDDSSGIEKIYSGGKARSPDSYDATASNGSFSTASVITSLINSTSKTVLVQNLDLTTTSDVDYYKFTAPSGGTGKLTAVVKSAGLSLLSPKFYLYNSSQTQIGTAGTSGTYGATYSTTVSGITAGQVYYVKVVGAETLSSKLAFNTGAYALTLNFGTGANPTVPLPNTQTANGSPLTGTGGVAENSKGRSNLNLSLGGDDDGPSDSYGPAETTSRQGATAGPQATTTGPVVVSSVAPNQNAATLLTLLGLTARHTLATAPQEPFVVVTPSVGLLLQVGVFASTSLVVAPALASPQIFQVKARETDRNESILLTPDLEPSLPSLPPPALESPASPALIVGPYGVGSTLVKSNAASRCWAFDALFANPSWLSFHDSAWSVGGPVVEDAAGSVSLTLPSPSPPGEVTVRGTALAARVLVLCALWGVERREDKQRH